MQSFSEVLNLVKSYFQEKVKNNDLTETAYKCWIENIEPVRLENNTCLLYTSDVYKRQLNADIHGIHRKSHLNCFQSFL